MRREELYVADLVDNARAIREYLGGVPRVGTSLRLRAGVRRWGRGRISSPGRLSADSVVVRNVNSVWLTTLGMRRFVRRGISVATSPRCRACSSSRRRSARPS